MNFFFGIKSKEFDCELRIPKFSISGTVEGNLDIQLKVVLGKNSYLTGNLKAAIITIEEGAKFDGMCSMIQKQTATIKNGPIPKTSGSLKAANEQV